MSQLIKMDSNYAKWIQDISMRFQSMQIKAATKVNREMLLFYLTLGRDIVELHADSKWGNKFYANLSRDLAEALPNVKSFSETNLKIYEIFLSII